MVTESFFTKKLTERLRNLPISKWGIANISGFHALGTKFPRALLMLMAYSPRFHVDDEGQYDPLLKEVGSKLDKATSEVDHFFESNRIKHFPLPQGGQDLDTLLAMFPHKLTAVLISIPKYAVDNLHGMLKIILVNRHKYR